MRPPPIGCTVTLFLILSAAAALGVWKVTSHLWAGLAAAPVAGYLGCVLYNELTRPRPPAGPLGPHDPRSRG